MGKMIIDLQIACEQEIGLPTAEQIEQWATAAVQPQNDEVEMTVRIVDEAESYALNLNYRGKDRPTNVLSFPFECPDEVKRRDKTNLSWRIGRTWWCTAVCICLVMITLKMMKRKKWKAWKPKS